MIVWRPLWAPWHERLTVAFVPQHQNPLFLSPRMYVCALWMPDKDYHLGHQLFSHRSPRYQEHISPSTGGPTCRLMYTKLRCPEPWGNPKHQFSKSLHHINLITTFEIAHLVFNQYSVAWDQCITDLIGMSMWVSMLAKRSTTAHDKGWSFINTVL